MNDQAATDRRARTLAADNLGQIVEFAWQFPEGVDATIEGKLRCITHEETTTTLHVGPRYGDGSNLGFTVPHSALVALTDPDAPPF